MVNGYAITSANDEHDRDPLNWTLYGSNDGNDWSTLDIRSEEDFTDYFQTKYYSFINSTAYNYYRLDMTNNSGDILQLAEIQLFGYGALKSATTFESKSDLENYIEFYPNPADGYIFINSAVENYSVEIFNIRGMLKYRRNYNVSKSQICVQDFPNGMYILKIESKDATMLKKILIAH